MFKLVRRSTAIADSRRADAEKRWLKAFEYLESLSPERLRKRLNEAANSWVFVDDSEGQLPPLGMQHTVKFVDDFAKYGNAAVADALKPYLPDGARPDIINSASFFNLLYQVDYAEPEGRGGADALSNFNLLSVYWNCSLGKTPPGEGRKKDLLGEDWCAFCSRSVLQQVGRLTCS